MNDPLSRRAFLSALPPTALCTLLFDVGFGPGVASPPRWPREAAVEFFTPEQLRVLAALTDRILPPADPFPGAAALGAPRFIDRMLARFFADQGELFLRGLEELPGVVARVHGDGLAFTSLSAEAMDEVLGSMEGEEFFEALRSYTIFACFTLPEHGGNADGAGWRLMGFTHLPAHAPPFGYYDLGYVEPTAPSPTPDAAPPPPEATPIPARSDDDVDFVIVGAGAAGGAIAWELARAGLRVVLLEQGPYLTESDFSHDEVTVIERYGLTNHPDRQPQTFRQAPGAEERQGRHLVYGRAVGGGTLHFTANYWRFRPVDFREGTLLGGLGGTGIRDWPIDYDELEPYYTRAEYVVGVSGLAGSHPFDPPRSAPYPLPPLPVKSGGVLFERGARALGWHPFPAPMAVLSRPWRGRAPCQHCGFCQEFGCEWGAKSSSMASVIREAERTGRCEVRPHSYVRKVEIDARGRATGVIYFDRDGREIFQRARAVVVAANGAETPRLLLLSRSNLFPHGLANSSGLVGRYLMFNTGVQCGGLYERRLDEWKSVQASRVLWDFYDTRLERGFYGGGGLDARFGSVTPARFADDLEEVVEPRWGDAYRDAIARRFSRTMAVATHGTSLPLESNTVDLDPELTDAWGLPALRTTYRDHPDDLACTRFLAARALEVLEAAGALETWSEPVRERMYSAHLLGTCRMGDDPRTSVVDRNHRAHDVPNLFLCDGSSFVTSGRGQPTCTISALGFRAGERMARAARRGEI